MFGLNKSLELPSQLEWKFAHEPELMAWTIKVRNYNTLVANSMFVFMSVLIMWWTYFLHSPPGEDGGTVVAYLASVIFYIVCSLTIASMTHQRINCTYRLSSSGVEHCEWKDFPKWALTFLKWLAGLTAVVFVFMATIDPSFLLGALIGPGGIGLTYLLVANSKEYQELQTEYHHCAFKWADIERLAIVTNREIVEFKYGVVLKGKEHITRGGVNVFCKKNKKTEVAELIRSYLSPDIPFIKTKADVPQY